jgi:hypothetical protein
VNAGIDCGLLNQCFETIRPTGRAHWRIVNRQWIRHHLKNEDFNPGVQSGSQSAGSAQCGQRRLNSSKQDEDREARIGRGRFVPGSEDCISGRPRAHIPLTDFKLTWAA